MEETDDHEIAKNIEMVPAKSTHCKKALSTFFTFERFCSHEPILVYETTIDDPVSDGAGTFIATLFAALLGLFHFPKQQTYVREFHI